MLLTHETTPFISQFTLMIEEFELAFQTFHAEIRKNGRSVQYLYTDV